VIRRGFWLVAGAVLGISGYRRLTRLVNAGKADRRAAGSAAFVRDVRAGMADYMDRHRDI
jgi:hypothetical protein